MAFQKNTSGPKRLTANTVETMRRNAARSQCPTCGRKSALRFIRDWGGEGIHFKYCFWSERTPKLCTYSEVKGLDPGTPLAAG